MIDTPEQFGSSAAAAIAAGGGVLVNPKRFQLSRRKGYRKPEGGIVCTRASKWGNPFRVIFERRPVRKPGSRSPLSRCPVRGSWVVRTAKGFVSSFAERGEAVECAPDHFRIALRFAPSDLGFTVDDVRRELAGKDLGCFCALDAPCHVDVLLRVVNGGEP